MRKSMMSRAYRAPLLLRVAELSVKRWPDPWTVSDVRLLSSMAATRLMVGAVVGMSVGATAAALGILFSGVNLRDGATAEEMAKLVAVFAVGCAVIMACVFDFTHIYLRFLQWGNERWARRVFPRHDALWDDGLDSHRDVPRGDEGTAET